MLGKPKFKYGDLVKFMLDGETRIGEIYIVDSFGTFFDGSDVSYDILCDMDLNGDGKKQPVLVKHVNEKFVSSACKFAHGDCVKCAIKGETYDANVVSAAFRDKDKVLVDYCVLAWIDGVLAGRTVSEDALESDSSVQKIDELDEKARYLLSV